jgi:YD repeat-containing protein
MAHRPVIDPAQIDAAAMLRMAQSLSSNDVPPMVLLRTLREDRASPNIDFFGASGEGLFDTPGAIARVVHGVTRRERSIEVAALPSLPGITNLTWRWVLLQGDPARVKIEPLNDQGSTVRITVGHHDPFPVEPGAPLLSSRVDIGAFASNGMHVSAPAFVTFFYPRNEIRRYDNHGRILSVDYAGAAERYSDPALTPPKRWSDAYAYDGAGRLTGWTRRRGDQSERFTADGLLIERVDARGRAVTARDVRYLPRQTAGDSSHPPELIQVNGEMRATYRYANDDDLRGEIATRVKAPDTFGP